jgi:hypothetical protein
MKDTFHISKRFPSEWKTSCTKDGRLVRGQFHRWVDAGPFFISFVIVFSGFEGAAGRRSRPVGLRLSEDVLNEP